MKTVTKWLASGSGIIALLLIFACNKDNSAGSNSNIPPGKSQLSVYMMDDPSQFTKVLIDIRQVVVAIDTSASRQIPMKMMNGMTISTEGIMTMIIIRSSGYPGHHSRSI